MTHFFASFSQRIDHIQSHHRALVDRPWLGLPAFGNLAVTGVLASCLLIGSYLVSPTKFMPPMAVPTQVVSALQSLQSVTDKKQVVMASRWDYGYSSLLFNRSPVFADGGSQVSPPTDMMAKALLAPSLWKTAAILRFLARQGGSGIAAHPSSQKALFDHIAISAAAPAPPIYFMLTNQMTGWINSISKIGNRNLDTGQAVPVRGSLGGPSLNYNMLQCKPAVVRHQLSCNGYIFDLRSGQVDGKLCLDGAVQTRNGQQVGRVNFSRQQVNMFQLTEIDQEQIDYLLQRNLFQSSFDKLSHLGRADNRLFEMICDDYLHVRIFRLQSQ